MLQSKQIINPKQLLATATSIYTNPAATKTLIKTVLLHNTNTSTETVKLYFVVASGGNIGTPVVANRLINRSIISNDTVFITMPYPLILSSTNDALFGESTTANMTNILLLGEIDA